MRPYIPAVNFFNIFRSALFPRKCISCNTLFYLPETEKSAVDAPDMIHDDIKQVFTYVMSPFLCRSCILDFSPIESPLCTACGFMYPSREGEDHICGKCLARKNRFHTARSAGIHDNALMTAVHHFKYKGKIQLAVPLGMVLFAALLKHYDINDIDLIIPIPLHKKRLRHRGFNQAYLLAGTWRKFARLAGPDAFHPDFNGNVLIRHRHTPPQVHLDREQRKKNLKNAFTVTHPPHVRGRRILLVDDVFTTGSTVDECAKVLLNKGAKQIDVLTLARAV